MDAVCALASSWWKHSASFEKYLTGLMEPDKVDISKAAPAMGDTKSRDSRHDGLSGDSRGGLEMASRAQGVLAHVTNAERGVHTSSVLAAKQTAAQLLDRSKLHDFTV
jgi:hypothetical protein